MQTIPNWTDRVSNLNLGMNRDVPNDATGMIQFGHPVSDDGNLVIHIGSINYGGVWTRYSLALNGARQFHTALGHNISLLNDLFRPVGIRLRGPEDSLDVPEGTALRLEGTDLVIALPDGERRVPVAQFDISFLRANQAQPMAR